MTRRHNVWAHLRNLLEEPGSVLFDGRWYPRLTFRSTAGRDSSKVADGTIGRRNLIAALAAGPLLMLCGRTGRVPRAGLADKMAMFARKVCSKGIKTR
ncbi:MAG: hypothetical protein P8182_14930 [Deltaproteobacteria bacterium]